MHYSNAIFNNAFDSPCFFTHGDQKSFFETCTLGSKYQHNTNIITPELGWVRGWSYFQISSSSNEKSNFRSKLIIFWGKDINMVPNEKSYFQSKYYFVLFFVKNIFKRKVVFSKQIINFLRERHVSKQEIIFSG